MSFQPHDKDRGVVPRWRPLNRTKSAELRSAAGFRIQPLDDRGELRERIERWQADPTIENAVEVVDSAVVLGRWVDGIGAARQIVAPGSNATEAAKRLSGKLVSGIDSVHLDPDFGHFDPVSREKLARQSLRNHRARLKVYPRNPLLWVDTARLYSVLGQSLKATDAMRRALHLCPANRFALRSAARLFVHQERPDKAFHILSKNPGTKQDPWLLAAQIAIGSIAGKPSRNARHARGIVDKGDFSDFQISELRSALATLELSAGATKKSLRLFRGSLIEPTDNSVAQAAWASRLLPNLDLAESLVKTPQVYEAKTTAARLAGDWHAVLENCQKWAVDEPFSVRPNELGSYVADTITLDFALAERFALAGLLGNRKNSALWNNLAVARINLGKTADAEEALKKATKHATSFEMNPTLAATDGLIKFRTGDVEAGRALYLQAIESFRQIGRHHSRVLAMIHWVREESNARTEKLSELVDHAEKEIDLLKSPGNHELRAAFLAALPWEVAHSKLRDEERLDFVPQLGSISLLPKTDR